VEARRAEADSVSVEGRIHGLREHSTLNIQHSMRERAKRTVFQWRPRSVFRFELSVHHGKGTVPWVASHRVSAPPAEPGVSAGFKKTSFQRCASAWPSAKENAEERP